MLLIQGTLQWEAYGELYSGRPTGNSTVEGLRATLQWKAYREHYSGRPTGNSTVEGLRATLQWKAYREHYSGRPTGNTTTYTLAYRHCVTYVPSSTCMEPMVRLSTPEWIPCSKMSNSSGHSSGHSHTAIVDIA